MPTCYRHPDRETHIGCQRCGRSICPDCMVDAAVGFQCPTCVAEGRKETRSGRTTYGGTRSGDPARTSIALITLNVAVWLAIMLTGGAGSRLVDLLGLRPNGLCESGGGFYDVPRATCDQAGAWLPGFSDGAYWQLLTSGFTHVTIFHIGFNMLALWVIGPQLEAALGRVRFLAVYAVSLLAGSAVVLWASPEFQLTLGASGAIYGLFAALLVMVRKVGGEMRQLWILMGINVFITFAVPNISWQGHLGGFLGGALVTAALVYAPRTRRTAVQAAAVGTVTLLLLAAVVTRTLLLS